MRVSVVVVMMCFVINFANAQDLSEFDNKKGTATIKTECFVQNFASGEKEECKNFETTRYYGVNGELDSKVSKQSEFVSESKYTHEFDKDGRVVKRTKKETWTMGKGPTNTRTTLVWEYTYDDTGAATVVCKEIEEKKEEEDAGDPDSAKELLIVETWKLDSAGRVLKYSQSLGAVENYRVEFKRDEKGKLLSKTEASGELWHSKETFTYRDDGTLKESEMLFSSLVDRFKKQYDSVGLEYAGQMVNKDGKTTRQWTVERSGGTVPGLDIVTYKIYGADPEKLEMSVRYMVETTTSK